MKPKRMVMGKEVPEMPQREMADSTVYLSEDLQWIIAAKKETEERPLRWKAE